MRRWAVASAVVALVIAAFVVVRPFVAAQRDFAAEVPSPASLVDTDSVPLARGAPVCFANAVIEPHSQQARFKIATGGPPAPALRMDVRGTGYHQSVAIPAGAANYQLLQVPITPPAVATPVRVCFHDRGRRAIALLASNDRTRSRSTVVVGGTPVDKSVWFAFYEATPQAITERLPLIFQRMATFRPGYVVPALLWVLCVLFVLGVPAAVVWAYVRGAREDEALAGAPLDVNRRRSRWRRWVG
jgi:hypothetical protein